MTSRYGRNATFKKPVCCVRSCLGLGHDRGDKDTIPESFAMMGIFVYMIDVERKVAVGDGR